MVTNRMNFLASQEHLSKILLIGSVVSFKYDRKLEQMKTSKVYTCYSIFVICFIQFCFVVLSKLFLNHFQSRLTESVVAQMVLTLQTLILEFQLVLFFWNGIARRNLQVNFLNSLVEIERAVHSLCKIQSSSFLRTFSLKYLAMVVIYYILLFISKLNLWSTIEFSVVVIILSYIASSIFFSIFVLYLIMAVKMQRHMFKVLNTDLEAKLKKPNGPRFKDLKEVMILHNKLHKSINMFNESFGIACVAIFVFNVGLETCQTYNGIISAMIDNLNMPRKNIILALQNMIWILPQICLTFQLNIECEKSKEEAEKVNFIFGNFNDFKNKHLKEMVRLFGI